MEENNNNRFDGLIIGGGIAGLQAALDLADQGFSVLIVEKEPSIGGKMIGLSKVFPTLDCASCICTPRMAAAAHHDNITIMTYTDVKKVSSTDKGFMTTVIKKPRFVDEKDCIGCSLCEYACPVYVPHEFEGNLGARKAIYIPFSNAIPQVALLDIENCIFCGLCEKACPAGAMRFLQESQELTIESQVIIVTTGYKMTPIGAKTQYGHGKFKNVLDPLQMERLLAPHGPYGRILRPSDGKVPDSIGYVQCAGSRDKSLGISYCSRVCCMYAIKQAMLLTGALPLVDVTIYYMDIRAFGKGFEQFYQNAIAMGIEFVKAKVAKITEDYNQNPMVRIEMIDEDGRIEEKSHDMVVLSLGIVPEWDPTAIVPINVSDDGFIQCKEPQLSPTHTNEEGIFVAGVAASPKDIPDSIIEASAAAMEASIYLHNSGGDHPLTELDRELINEEVIVTK
jgi:heterodisulfide reductase subunit A